jgi:cytochrome b6-f complex iron-sulfur subunit
MMESAKNNVEETTENIAAEKISRRNFFSLAWKGLGIIAFLETAGVITTFFSSGRNKKPDESRQLLEAGQVSSFGPGTVSAFMGGRFYLARLKDGGFIAVSLRCTHLGCSVAWKNQRKDSYAPAILRLLISTEKY